MRVVTYLAIISTLLTGVMVPAHAQWPLGREGLQESKSSEGPPYLTGTGRFQIFVSPQAKGYTFMIDTDTGKIWIMKKDHTSGEFSMQRIPVDQIDPKESAKPQSEAKKSTDKETSGKK
jgi:hypothetical protein